MTRSLWRSPAFWTIAAFLVALGLFLAFAVFGIQTLFYDTEVNEEVSLHWCPQLFASDR
jgi:hypothetical protein